MTEQKKEHCSGTLAELLAEVKGKVQHLDFREALPCCPKGEI